MMCEYCSWEACIMNDCMANQWQCWFTAAIAEMMITVSHGFVVTPMTFLFRRRFITCCPYSVDILFHVVLIPHSVYLQVMIIRRRFISFCPNSDVGWRISSRPQIWWRYTHTAVDDKPISPKNQLHGRSTASNLLVIYKLIYNIQFLIASDNCLLPSFSGNVWSSHTCRESHLLTHRC